MENFSPEVKELLARVRQKYPKNLFTTTDFDEFTLHLKYTLGQEISTSTVKRLWGYVNDQHKPRLQTLDILCQYIGFPHFKDFCDHLKEKEEYNSSFFTTKQIHVPDLHAGDRVEIGWSPNRYLQLHYHGNHQFEVIEARNSKLQVGDQFECMDFYLEQPLILSHVWRNNQKTESFIAGRHGGLSLINLIAHE